MARPFSKKEVDFIKRCILEYGEGSSNYKIATDIYFHPTFKNRSCGTIYQKVREVRKNIKIESKTVAPKVSIEIPKGFTFSGTPKKVLLYEDKFEIYF